MDGNGKECREADGGSSGGELAEGYPGYDLLCLGMYDGSVRNMGQQPPSPWE